MSDDAKIKNEICISVFKIVFLFQNIIFMLDFHPQTVVDSEGKTNFVMLPIHEWLAIKNLLPMLLVLQAIKESMIEIKAEKQNPHRTFTSISDFLHKLE
jgi:hypothetical protein